MPLNDLIDWVKPRRRSKLGVRGTYSLTPLGKTKVEELSVEGPPWEVLSYLDEHGPSSLSEIGEGTHMHDKKVKWVTGKLMRSQYIRRSDQSE